MADQCRAGERTLALEHAATELTEALALFDGEDLEGEAWTRVWLGRIALERGRGEEAISWLEAARHGSAMFAAELFLGEAYLMSGRFMRAENVLAHVDGVVDRIPDDQVREPLDANWGDELPRSAFDVRWRRAHAEATCLAAGEWQGDDGAREAHSELQEAEHTAHGIVDVRIREACLALIYQAEARTLRSDHRLDEALMAIRKRLRIDPTPEAFALEAELLELRGAGGTTNQLAATAGAPPE